MGECKKKQPSTTQFMIQSQLETPRVSNKSCLIALLTSPRYLTSNLQPPPPDLFVSTKVIFTNDHLDIRMSPPNRINRHEPARSTINNDQVCLSNDSERVGLYNWEREIRVVSFYRIWLISKHAAQSHGLVSMDVINTALLVWGCMRLGRGWDWCMEKHPVVLHTINNVIK